MCCPCAWSCRAIKYSRCSSEMNNFDRMCDDLKRSKERFFELQFSYGSQEFEISIKKSYCKPLLVIIFDQNGEQQLKCSGYYPLPRQIKYSTARREQVLRGIGVRIDLDKCASPSKRDRSIFPVREGILDGRYILINKTKRLSQLVSDRQLYEGYLISRDASHSIKVAVQIYNGFGHIDCNEQGRTVEEMRKELILIQGIKSPSVINYYCLALESSTNIKRPCTAYLAMELCRRETLADVMNNFNPVQKKAVVIQLLRGLSHLHSNDIPHGNLTPKNVFLSKCGKHIKISGFSTFEEVNHEMSDDSMVVPSKTEHKFNKLYKQLMSWRRQQLEANPDTPMANDLFSVAVIICCCHFENQDWEKKWEERRQNGQILFTIDLIEAIILQQRCSAESILMHPYFWDYGKRFCFIEEVKKYFIPLDREKIISTLEEEKKLFSRVKDEFKFNWLDDIVETTKEENERKGILETTKLKCCRPYDYKNIIDFIRFLRNTTFHYNENDSTKNHFSSYEDLWKFFETSPKFSKTFLELWKIIGTEAGGNSFLPKDLQYYFIDSCPSDTLDLSSDEE